MRRPSWLVFAVMAAVIAAVVVLTVVSRTTVPETEGTAPSVITDSTGAEAQPVTAPAPGVEPREVDASSTSGRAARGSGIEGMTSGGITSDPPGGR